MRSPAYSIGRAFSLRTSKGNLKQAKSWSRLFNLSVTEAIFCGLTLRLGETALQVAPMANPAVARFASSTRDRRLRSRDRETLTADVLPLVFRWIVPCDAIDSPTELK